MSCTATNADDVDIPAHCYQLSFESNPAWSTFYASAPEILEYWKKVADKYDVRKYMKLSHKVQEARWSEEEGRWHLKVEDLLVRMIPDDGGIRRLTISEQPRH